MNDPNYIDYRAIHLHLNKIKSGQRYNQYGICINLLLSLKNPHMSQTFMNQAIKAKYGSYQPYLIEGTRENHRNNPDKFDPSTQYGKARLDLLNYLLSYALKNF